jgi:hypothetical protein
MAETMAAPRVAAQQPAPAQQPAQAQAAPAAAEPTPVREQWYRNLQVILFTAGALLMPAGIFAIFLGWYGVAHTKYQYNQLPYVVSGGLLGLGLIFLGGFLYFGAWLAKMGNEQRESAQRLADTMLVLADIVARQGQLATVPGSRTEAGEPAATTQDGTTLVLAGAGSTVHRRDCPLIAHRDDLHALTGAETDLGTCRVCRPAVV